MKTNCAVNINLSEVEFNNIITKSVSEEVRNYKLESRVLAEATRKIDKIMNKYLTDGTLTNAVAKRLVKGLDLDKVLSIIDVEELKHSIVERVSEKLVGMIKI